MVMRILRRSIPFLVVMASAAYYWHYPILLTAFYAVGSALLFSRWHRLDDIIYYIVALVVAPLGELIAVKNGAWQYAGSGTGIPLWLPLAWGICALSLRRLSETVAEVAKEWKALHRRRPHAESGRRIRLRPWTKS